MEQLDIFANGRDRLLINQLAEALLSGGASAAHSAALALRAEFPGDRHLALAAVLADALAAEAVATSSAWPPDAVAAALAARRHLVQQVAPTARQMLGNADAALWLAARWRALALRAARLPYSKEHADTHAAALWLQAGRWADAALAAETIDSWRRRPVPLAWVAEARWHLSGADAAWPLIAELAWLAPVRVPALIALLPDAGIRKLARCFESGAADELSAGPAAPAAAWAWWPCWLLIEQPLLAGPLSNAEPRPEGDAERAFSVLRALLQLERQGRHPERVAHRRQLMELSPVLFRSYMAMR